MRTDNQPANFSDIPTFLAGTNGLSILTHKAVDDDAVERALKSLTSAINDSQRSEKQSIQRLPYQGRPVIVLERAEEMICFEAWGRDVSQCGASFLCSKTLIPIDCINGSETHLQLDSLVMNQCRTVIGLEQEIDTWIWLLGQVTHLNILQGGLYEIDVKFVEDGK